MKPAARPPSPTTRSSRSRTPRLQAAQVAHLRDLSRSLPMALMRARESVMQYFRPHHRRHGVTEQQWRVLRVLHRAGEIEIADLARQTMLLAPSLSRILRDLVAANMVVRRPVAHDLRRSLVSLGAAGVAVLAKVAPLSEASYATIIERFGARRLNELFELLYGLEQSLDADDARIAPGPHAARRKKANGAAARVRESG